MAFAAVPASQDLPLSFPLSLSCCSEPSVEDNRWLGEKKGAFKPPMLTSVKKSYVICQHPYAYQYADHQPAFELPGACLV